MRIQIQFENNCYYISEIMQLSKIMEEYEEAKKARLTYKYSINLEQTMCQINKIDFGNEIIDCMQSWYTYLINNFDQNEINEILKNHYLKMKKRY